MGEMLVMKYKFLNELNYATLKNRTQRGFGNGRNQRAQRVQIKSMFYLPAPQNNILQVIATTSTDADDYKTIIVFDDVTLELERTPNSVGFVSPSGVKYYFNTISKHDDIKVTCSCPDFYWRFATFDDQQNALYGSPPPPYIKKTNAPHVNPFKVPGVCKHIIKVMNRLQRRRFFT